METMNQDSQNPPTTVVRDANLSAWIAPLQSIQTFSIAEFTKNFSSPGDDGLGTFTGS